MAAGIEIQVGKIRGPWPYVFIEGRKKDHVVGVVPLHPGPGLAIPVHASKPEVLPGVWNFPTNAQETARGIKLVAVQSKLFAKDLKGIHRPVRRWRFQLVVDKASVGFFKVEGVAIVRHSNITSREQFMQLFNEHPVILDISLIPLEVWKSPDCNLLITRPLVGKA